MQSTYVDPTTDPRWQHFVTSRRSSVFHSPGWTRALKHTYDLDVRAYLACDDEDTPQAGIPFCRIDDIAGLRIVSLPFSDFCDPLVDQKEYWTPWFEASLAEECPIVNRCLHNELPLSEERFPVYNKAKWHGADLQPDADDIWKRIDEGSRRAIRKAKKNGVTVRVAEDKDDLRAFYDMHLKIRKYKYKLLAQPYSFFENIWDHCVVEQDGFLMLAIHDDTVIGGVFFLGWQDTIYYKFNASSAEGLAYRPNDTVIWEGLQYAKAKGYTFMDFGLSDWDQEGLIRYKRKFATDEKTIHFLRHTPEGYPPPQTSRIRGLLPQLTDLFTDESVPDDITEQAGDTLYRFFT